jgi:hypothetical protein
VLTLGPNTIGDPDPFWYVGGRRARHPGNKNMDANMYVQSESLSGQDVTFTGNVISNTLVSPYTSVAFIKDFAPDFSSFSQITVPLTPGVFSITLPTNPGAGRHVQYGSRRSARTCGSPTSAQGERPDHVRTRADRPGAARRCGAALINRRRRAGRAA